MWLYISLLFLIFCGLVYEQSACPAYSPRTRGFGAFLLVFLIGLIVGVRDMLGGYDVYCYANFFEGITNRDLSLDMFFSLGGENKKDAGWIFYNKVIHVFSENKYALFFVTSVLSYLFLFFHLRRYAPYFFFALLIIFCRQFLQSFVYIRQFFACMVAWFAVDFAIKRKPIPFIATVFFAANIHLGALVFAPVYFIARWKMPVVVILGGIFTAMFLGLTPAFGAFLNSFGETFENEKALGYVESTGGGVHPFYAAEGVLIALALLVSRKSVYGDCGGRSFSVFSRLNKYIPIAKVESNPNTKAMFNITFLYVCASLTTLQSPGMMRLIWVFWIGPICMLPYICEKMDAGKSAAAFKFVIILYFIAAFWLFACRFDGGDLLYYKTFLF